MRIATVRNLTLAAFLGASIAAGAQVASPEGPRPPLPTHFPVRFTNLVWWSDSEIRAELAKRIPGLPAEIATHSSEEARIRRALEGMLLAKGIKANVTTLEPSLDLDVRSRAAAAPPVSIDFSVLPPIKVMVGEITIDALPGVDTSSLLHDAHPPIWDTYDESYFWMLTDSATQFMKKQGYLTATAQIVHGEPKRTEGQTWVTPLHVELHPGQQFHVASISADGGPLVNSHVLESQFTVGPGDLATPAAFGPLPSSLQAFYRERGHEDVVVHTDPVLDLELSLATYRLTVDPGPQYLLGAVTIKGLTPEQEKMVRDLLAIGPSEPYSESAVMRLYGKIRSVPSLPPSFSYRIHRDLATKLVDLTLVFSRS